MRTHRMVEPQKKTAKFSKVSYGHFVPPASSSRTDEVGLRLYLRSRCSSVHQNHHQSGLRNVAATIRSGKIKIRTQQY